MGNYLKCWSRKKDGKGEEWGKNSGGSYGGYEECPTLEIPKGALRVFCDGSTCAVDCKPGLC